VDVGYACAAIFTEGQEVVRAAPIFQWMIGKSRKEVRTWVERKGGEVTKIWDNVEVIDEEP
jgi:hypothetical protein